MRANKIDTSSWQPSATSTPCRSLIRQCREVCSPREDIIKPSNFLKNILQNNFGEAEDLKNKKASKLKSRKQKEYVYFEVRSSSSDDEDDNFCNKKNKIHLKINSSSSDKRKDIFNNKKIDFKNSEIGKTGKEKEHITTVSKNTNNSSKTSNLDMSKSVSVSCSDTFIKVDRKRKSSVNLQEQLDNSFMIEKIVSSKLDKSVHCIDDTDKSSNNVNGKQKSLENYFSVIKNKTKSSNKDNQLESTNNCMSKAAVISPNANLKPLNESNNPKTLHVSKNMRQEIQSCKSSLDSVQKSKRKTKIACKTKNNSIKNDEIPLKKTKLKAAQENITENLILSPRKNSFHQLFSDVKKEELINSLDMTKEDLTDEQNNLVDRNTASLHVYDIKSKRNSAHQNVCFKEKESNVDSSGLEKKTLRSLNANNKLKITKSNMSEQAIHQNEMIDQNSIEVKLSSQFKNSAEKENNCMGSLTLKSRNYITEIRKGSAHKKAAMTCESVFKNQVKHLKPTEEMKNVTPSDENVQGSEAMTQVPECTSTNSNKSEIVSEAVSSSSSNITEFKPGCFITQYCSLKNFKCGMLQMQAKSAHTSKTNNKYSYFGGVVVKGCLKMEIGEKEFDLKEGDSAFVPPLTTWTVNNTEDNDANMYYWCGKFKS